MGENVNYLILKMCRLKFKFNAPLIIDNLGGIVPTYFYNNLYMQVLYKIQ